MIPGALRFNPPHLQKSTLNGRDFRIDYPAPIRRVVYRIERKLLNNVGANEGNEQIEGDEAPANIKDRLQT